MLTDTLCAALTAAGLAIAILTAYRRRYLAATRMAALALLPLGLAMAGLVTLGRKVGTAGADWAADLVFKPSVWLGFGVLACSGLLYGVSRLFSRRTPRDGQVAGGAAVPAASGGSAPAAVTAGRSAKPRSSSSDGGLSDFSDVEEILKRRGI